MNRHHQWCLLLKAVKVVDRYTILTVQDVAVCIARRLAKLS
jgi:hypothetical protein